MGDAPNLPILKFYQINSVWFNFLTICGVYVAGKM